MQVKKRDGQIVKFDANKIMEAISGANRDVKGREKASIANKKEIVKFMMNYDIDYKIHEYSGYTQEFNEYAAQEDGFKIYLLDIVTQEG